MSLPTDIVQLTERVAAVNPAAWESAGDTIGYGVTHQGMLDLLAEDFRSLNYDDFLRHRTMTDNIRRALPMGEQAKFDSAAVCTPTITPSNQSYLDALEAEMGAIGAAGASLGRAIISPVTGAANAALNPLKDATWAIVIPLAIAAIAILYMWKK